MAKTTFNSFPDNTTDANFRAWGSGLSAALATVGLIQTADTGQINWATVTHPTVTGASQGYEIWRLNDALQSTAPFYLKLEYGGSPGNANNPCIFITTGTGSTGTGGLVNASSRWVLAANTNSTTTQFTSYVAGDAGGVGVGLWGGSSNSSQPVFFFLDRSKGSDGSDTAIYLSVLWASSNNSTNTNVGFYTHGANAGVSSSELSGTNVGSIPGPFTLQSNTQASGNIALIPIMPCLGFFQYPLRRAISGRQGDWTNGDTPSISLYPGVTDSYMVFKIGGLSSTSTTWIFGPAGSTNSSAIQNYCVIMRWQ